VQVSSHVLNTHVAPGLGGFKDADIPDLRPEYEQAEHWLANHFLSSVLRGCFEEGIRQLVLGVVGRAYYGFSEYHLARDATLRFLGRLAEGAQPLQLYWDALHHWEGFVLEVQMATALQRKLLDGRRLFDDGDGTPLQRLYAAANKVKHAGEVLAEGTVPLWVLADGLHAVGGIVVGYGETADVLRDVANTADRLQDPLSFMESVMETRHELQDDERPDGTTVSQ